MTTPSDLRGRRCLVLGAGGFIGTNLCRHLAACGAEVAGFGRAPAYPRALQGIAWTVGEFADRAALARAVEGNELVFHLIGSRLPESSNRDPIGDLDANVVSTLHLLEACRRSAVAKLVFASSGGTVYGVAPPIPIPETAPTEPITAYGIGKLAVEKYLSLYQRLYGLDYAVLRISNPFGPFQGGDRRQGVVAAFIHQALRGATLEIWGDGEVVRDFVYIDDVVAALAAAALQSGPHRLFNVGQGVGRSVNQVIADIESVLERGPLARRYRPSRAADVPVNILDIGLIGRELGWQPRADWLASLRATARWLADPAAPGGG